MTPEQKQLLSEIRRRYKQGETAWHLNDIAILLSLVKEQETGSDLAARDEVLAFFGASMKENGDIHIDMKKYHVAHLCHEHSFQPWRRNEIENKCAMCLARDRESATARMRSACVEKVKAKAKREREFGAEYNVIRAVAFDSLAAELETLSIEQPKEQG